MTALTQDLLSRFCAKNNGITVADDILHFLRASFLFIAEKHFDGWRFLRHPTYLGSVAGK